MDNTTIQDEGSDMGGEDDGDFDWEFDENLDDLRKEVRRNLSKVFLKSVQSEEHAHITVSDNDLMTEIIKNSRIISHQWLNQILFTAANIELGKHATLQNIRHCLLGVPTLSISVREPSASGEEERLRLSLHVMEPIHDTCKEDTCEIDCWPSVRQESSKDLNTLDLKVKVTREGEGSKWTLGSVRAVEGSVDRDVNTTQED